MKHGIPANETRFTFKSERNRITYQFVTDDGCTPSGCTIHLGDTDPLTGEKLADPELFLTYYRQVDSEIHRTMKCLHPAYTDEQKAWRRKESQRYKAAFEEEYGYSPSRDDIIYHLQQLEEQRYCLYYDGLTNADGESMTDCMPDFGRRDEYPSDLLDDVLALRELAETLTGRKRDVYDAMLHNLGGGSPRITNVSIAKRWGVTENCIRQDQEQIKRKIRDKIKG